MALPLHHFMFSAKGSNVVMSVKFKSKSRSRESRVQSTDRDDLSTGAQSKQQETLAKEETSPLEPDPSSQHLFLLSIPLVSSITSRLIFRVLTVPAVPDSSLVGWKRNRARADVEVVSAVNVRGVKTTLQPRGK